MSTYVYCNLTPWVFSCQSKVFTVYTAQSSSSRHRYHSRNESTEYNSCYSVNFEALNSRTKKDSCTLTHIKFYKIKSATTFYEIFYKIRFVKTKEWNYKIHVQSCQLHQNGSQFVYVTRIRDSSIYACMTCTQSNLISILQAARITMLDVSQIHIRLYNAALFTPLSCRNYN